MYQMDQQYHIHCRPGDVGRYCILPGDPGRVPRIAALLEDAAQVAYNREFNVYTGTLAGEKVTVCSTGIGGPSAAIAMEELHKCGADTFVRTGTCGGIAMEVCAGDIVVATGAIRYEHTSLEYALQHKWESWKRLGVKASEMESAALFVVAAALGCRCGSCFRVVWNQERQAAGLGEEPMKEHVSSIRVAVEGLRRLIEADRAAAAPGGAG